MTACQGLKLLLDVINLSTVKKNSAFETAVH
jgi:hypothetical protein